jgi:indolepyruvate ferredoxin oxidoreductase
VKRQPYFCSGCPHNISTKVPEGSRAQAGIGCHFMASWMERGTEGLIQMGAEGVDWVAASRFTHEQHVFQNLGDGTYFHSGLLAIRQAIAARARMTYKVLYNDAVAMTGGQPVDGKLSVPEIARQVQAEGATQVAIVSDDIGKYSGMAAQFPPGTTFHDRAELDDVQRRLRDAEGVTLLIYDQVCAAEKRRRRKKGEMVDPKTRVFINPQVCEGCGDCGVQSNCLSIVPLETDWGRKRAIEQSSCNKDYSCVNGFCPSFVTLEGAVLKKRQGGGLAAEALTHEVSALHEPAAWMWTGPFDMMVTGVGGTGVVTVGALVTMAAHLEGKQASVLDFMGFAQKGGAVLSFVRIAPTADLLNQVRIDTQQADILLACDLVVGASPDALGTVKHGRTEVIANRHEIATAAFVRNPDASLHSAALLDKLRHAAGAQRLRSIDAQGLADELLGDTLPSNIVMLGAAWQAGLVPVSHAALMRAIELNGVAVTTNQAAFAIGRLALAAPEALARLRVAPAAPDDSLDALIARRRQFLTDYQDAKYAERYARFIDTVRQAENRLAPGLPLELTRTVALQLARLMAIKDEYEVARLHSSATFAAQLHAQFERWDQLNFHLAPPGIARVGSDGKPRKMRFGPWLMPLFRGLAKLRGLRGGVFDVFGHSAERRMERALIGEYQQHITSLLPALSIERLPLALRIARVPEGIRGYGHVKAANVASARAQWVALMDRWQAGGAEAAVPPAPPTQERKVIPMRVA